MNVLELKATKLAILAFTIKKKKIISTHVLMDSMVALSYLMKTWGWGAQKYPIISHYQQRNLGLPFGP